MSFSQHPLTDGYYNAGRSDIDEPLQRISDEAPLHRHVVADGICCR